MPILSNRRWWLLAVALAVGLAGAGELLSVALRGSSQPSAVPDSAMVGYRKVVAFGHVDVEAGVCRMYVTVPGGLVTEVLVKEGESVSTGAVLVRLDDTEARGKVDEAKAAVVEAKARQEAGRSLPEQYRSKLEQAEAVVRAAEAQRDGALSALEYKQRLELSKTIGADAVTIAKNELRALEEAVHIKQADLTQLRRIDPMTEVKVLDAQVARAEALLRQAEAILSRYTLVAPTAGTVLEITVRVGDTVGSASPVPAVQFCPEGRRIVRAGIDQAYASQVAVDQKVTIEDDTNAGGRWTGRVKWVGDVYTPQRPVSTPDPNQFSDVRTLPCIIEIDPDQPPLKINQRVLASIEVPIK